MMTLSAAVKHVNKKGILLVFPDNNKKEPASLWYEFFPRSRMKWEWDEYGDSRVSDLWHLREKLSRSGKVVYSKWYRGRATVLSFKVFTALLRLANPSLSEIRGLSYEARDILDLLEEDSPLSTKQIKKMAGLQGRSLEPIYNRAMKELWSRNLIVAFGEVDEGAFPSLAVGATRVLFEDIWLEAEKLSIKEADEVVASTLPPDSSFMRFYKSLQRQWAKQQAEQSIGDQVEFSEQDQSE